MPWTLTQFIADNFAQVRAQNIPDLCTLGPPPNVFAAATGLIPEWLEHVRGGYLAGVPNPNRDQYITTFEQHAQSRTRACLQNRTGSIGIIQMMDDTARDDLDAPEAGRVAAAPSPAPSLAHDPECLQPGVVCMGSPIGLDGQPVAPWPNRAAYSGNHRLKNDFAYRQGGGPQPLRLAFQVPAGNSVMILEAKPRSNLLGLLGDGRHAEDGWFARYFEGFVGAINAIQPGNLPPLANQTIWQQKATVPRVEFLMSMSPCPRNDANPQEGCAAYFSSLRAAIDARVPILIFYYRVWLANQIGRGIQSVDEQGAIVQHPQVWA